MHYKDILSNLIAIDSHTDKDTLECVHWIQNYLDSYNISSKLIYNPTKTRASLFANIGDGRQAMVFNGHLDTVPVYEPNWATNPFVLEKHDGKFFGRGVCDMKGAIACSLSLVPYFVKNKHNVGFLFTHDEEKAGKGIKESLADKELLHYLQNSAGVVVMEPTQRHLVFKHKNVGSMTVDVKGKSAHSSNPANGIDALKFSIKIAELFYNTLEEHKEIDSSFDVPWSTGIISQIHAGEAVNVVPDNALMKMSVRFMSDNARDIFIKEYVKRAQLLQQDIPGLVMNINVKPGLPALQQYKSKFANDWPFTRAQNVSYYTEAGRFSEQKINTVLFGPGNIAQAHTDNEYIAISELEGFVSDLQTIVSKNKTR